MGPTTGHPKTPNRPASSPTSPRSRIAGACSARRRTAGGTACPSPPAQRQAFRQAALDHRLQFLREHGLEDEPLEALNLTVQAMVARTAIRRPMESLGYLLVQRRPITPAGNSPLGAQIR